MSVKHLVVVPHTHWDREWYAPFESFRKRLVSMIDHLLEIMETDSAFKYFELDGQTIVLSDYLAIRPENETRLRKLIENGRILIGPWCVQPDEFLVTGESLIRNLRIGIRVANKFGKPSMIGYLPDQFGHAAQMPQIFSGFGINYAIVWRGVGDTVRQTQFLWEALDGTKVFTIYLADSYSNGATLPLKPTPLRERLSDLIKRQESYCDIESLLVMNGSDHLEPEAGLPEQLENAVRGLPAATFEMGNFGIFIKQARKQAPSLQVHTGEFRSSKRVPLIPGVTSVRVRQKQRDFYNCRLLEKYVEPLCTWAWLCGDARPHASFIDYAWRLTIENHPHDSICGCSVDAVHEEIETRFDKVQQLAESLQNDALSFLASRIDSSWAPADRPALCVYNPAPAREQIVDIVAEIEEPDFVNSLRTRNGELIPVQKTVGDRELYVGMQLTPGMVREQVAGMESRELIGFYINNILWQRDGKTLKLILIMGRAPMGEVDVEKLKRELIAVLDDPSLEVVDVKGVSGAKTRLTFFADDLSPGALKAYSISSEPAADFPGTLKISQKAVENDFYAVSVNDDGTLDIIDKQSEATFKGCLRFIDAGDRGDVYTFDEVPGVAIVDAPSGLAVVSIVESGPVRATLKVDACFHLPEKLTAERDQRSSNKIETNITTLVSLYRDIKRIDFLTTFDNQCEDHRLRVHFNAPFTSPVAFTETAFGIVKRPAKTEPCEDCFEKPIGTGPQKTFSCIENGWIGMALLNRGIPEIEAIEGENSTALALTLVRAVGWLSREDLKARPAGAGPAIETPGAQSKGPHSFEYAFISYQGNYENSNIIEQAHSYAFPPTGITTNRHKGKIKEGTSLAAVDNPNIVVSAVERSRLKGAFLVRLYNATGSAQRGSLAVWDKYAKIYEVNLLEKRVSKEPLQSKSRRVEFMFRPAEIKTLQVVRDE
ncbi:MAG: hypothetical protein HY801_07215 [Candidatus Lindowbacteria bacterium]|nr:hypothetical protein [Candidatus Lindowbacteria bacterium]